MEKDRIALVTGANRGLGLETVRQLGKLGYRVLLGSRDIAKGESAAKELAKDGVEAQVIALDITDANQISSAFEKIRKEHGRCDVLVNNAGVILEGDATGTLDQADTPDRIESTFKINTMSVVRMCQTFLPLMKENGFGRIVNLSSGLGQLDEMAAGWNGYRISKTAMNAITRIIATEVAGTNIKINSVCPGWVATDMGGKEATRSVDKGAETIVWAATLDDEGPSGGFFRDMKPIPW